jgi:hypothetical protein
LINQTSNRVILSLNAMAKDRTIAKRRFSWLLEHKALINKSLPGLEWINEDERSGCRVSLTMEGGYRSPPTEWPTIQTRAIDAMSSLHAATQSLIDSEEFRQL